MHRTSTTEPIAILGVNSSTNDKIYTVVIWEDSFSCNCPAGGIGTLCKHIKAIFDGNPKFLAEYSKEKEPELKQKLAEIIKNISPNTIEIFKKIEEIQKISGLPDKKELTEPLRKQIIKISKHTISEAFKQIKILENLEVATTTEELEAFNIIKLILQNHINVDEINYLDHKTFFEIKLKDKIICRLYLNGRQKTIAVLKNKKEIHTPINNIDDLYNHADLILQYL